MHIQDGVDKCHSCLEYIHVQVYVHFAVEQSNLLQGFIAVLLPIASLLQIKKFIVICNALGHLQYEDLVFILFFSKPSEYVGGGNGSCVSKYLATLPYFL